MEKEDRRQHYQQKEYHRKKDKQKRHKNKEQSSTAIGILDFDSPNNLKIFMNDNYDKTINKCPDNTHNINQQIIKNIFKFRESWIQEQKQAFVDFLRQNYFHNGEQIYDKLFKEQKGIYVKGQYCVSIEYNNNNEPRIRTYIARRDQRWGGTVKYFCAVPMLKELNFMINYKRFKKDIEQTIGTLDEMRKKAE